MADFKLGRIKFKWRGNWATSTAYLIDDVVKYGGNTYVCIQNHTSPNNENLFYTNPGTYTGYWSLQSEALFFKGAYGNSTWYKLNDLVTYGQRKYRCTTYHTSSSTVLDTSKFELYQDAVDYKGDWTADTYYKVNDVFKFGAYQYKVTTAHTSGANADAFDQSKVDIFLQAQEFKDTYNSSTVYARGDIVTYGGYTYIYVNAEEASGQTPTDNAYWDIVTTGYSNQGLYSHGTAYKTGDVVVYGGNSYVSQSNNTSEYPTDLSGNPNSTHWKLNVEGFNWRAVYSSGSTYNIGDVVEYSSSSYIAVADRVLGVTPGTDSSKWNLIAQGSTTNVLTTRGDILVRDATQTTRLPIGVAGSYLTTNGTDVQWSNAEGGNVKWVANAGSDSNPGTEALPYKTIKYALQQATSGDVLEVTSIAGGTGGTPGTFDVTQASTTGSGTGFAARVVTDGSSTPTITITNGGSGHAEGDTITITGVGSPTASSNITFDVLSVSEGDVIYVKNGVYKESLPLRVPAGVTLRGESLRGTVIQPASGTGTQIKTVSQSGGVGGTAGTYNYVKQQSTNGSGTGAVFNIVQDGSSAPTVTVYNGGSHYATTNTIVIPASQIGNPGSNLTLTVTAVENNNASNMLLLNNKTNITLFTFKGLTGTPGAGGTGKAAVTSLDPTGVVSTASPYIQDCTSSNANATGVQIDGNLHTSGNKSILCNDFTQINSDGRGVHTIAGGRGEMVSIFTYYCDRSFFAETGGFIRGLNCSSAYGEKGAVADGQDPDETPVNIKGRGEMLKYNSAGFVGAATESDIADTVSTSGTPTAATIAGASATATIYRTNVSTDKIYIENRSGNFVQGETVTITKDDSSQFQVTLDASEGDSTSAQTGQKGALIGVKAGTTALNATNVIKVGSNIKFSNDSTFYRVSAVSEENTTTQTALVRLTVNKTAEVQNNEEILVTRDFSNIRLTGHDFLSIGTGSFADTNYPGDAAQPADQSDEVDETNGGRVYFTSTDQDGDFRVGDLFRIQQATGIATLNADAFDLSGLSELQLGSIGAELGATINEFSTDETLGNDSNTAVPTERAVVGFLTRDKMGTGAFVPPTGTTAERTTGDSLFTGALRFNTSLVTWEGYNGTQWTGIGGGNPWVTKTNSDSPVTVAANDRMFIDTTGGAVTANLPGSPLVGDEVSFVDLASTFDTANLTIGRNGNKIMNQTADMTVSTEDAGIKLVYTGATYGWKLVQNF